MNVIGHVRVSTEDQVREGVSIDAQQARIEAYCMAKGRDMVSVEADKGLSAKDMNRPTLQRCVHAIESGDVEALVFYKLDRLTRSVVDLNMLVSLMESNGVALVSMRESLDATTPTGRLMMNLLSSVSQWEREIIAERTKEAISYLRDNMQVYNGSVYGFDARNGQFYPNPEEQDVIRETNAQRGTGTSYRKIAAWLNACEIQTKRGGRWHPATVHKINARA